MKQVCAAQIVGLKGGFHTGAVLSGASSSVHGERIAQAREVEVYFEMQSRLPCDSVSAEPCKEPSWN